MNATLPMVLFRDCQGFTLGLDIPADVALQHVPPEFGPASTVPFMAFMAVIGYDCPRISLENRTLGGGAVLWTYMVVVPRNQSWEGKGPSVYAFDVWATNQSLVDSMTLAGAHVALATLQKQALPPAAGITATTWEFASGSATMRFSFGQGDEPFDVAYEADLAAWFGPEPFARVDTHRKDTNYASFRVDGGRIEMEGASKFREALGADDVAGHGSAFYSLNWDMETVPKRFKA